MEDLIMPGLMVLVVTSAIVSGGYISRVSSNDAERRQRTVGRLLSLWVFVLASLFFVDASLSLSERGEQRTERAPPRPAVERHHDGGPAAEHPAPLPAPQLGGIEGRRERLFSAE